MTDPDTLRKLAAELCTAKEGSRDAEADIAAGMVGENSIIRTNPKPGGYQWKWKPPGCERWEAIPHWTRSLDARLPREDIATISRTASNKVVARDMRSRQCAEAHTEPLARRAAALLAMAERNG